MSRTTLACARLVLPSLLSLFPFFVTPLSAQTAGDANSDSVIDRRDIDLIVAARNTAASSPTDPRDVNRDGRIDAVDVRLATNLCSLPNCALPPGFVTVDNSPVELNLLVGEKANFSTNITYSTSDTLNRSLQISQTITPPSGISISPGIVASIGVNANKTELVNQTVTAATPGDYTIRTRVTLQPENQVSESIVTVQVLASAAPISLARPLPYPGSLAPNTTTPVIFSAALSNFDPASPPAVSIIGPGVNTAMRDDGIAPDLQAGDGLYSVSISVNSSGTAVGQCRDFRAQSGPVSSAPTSLCVSAFPLIPSVDSNPTNPFTDPASGFPVVNNELIVIFKAGVTESTINMAASSIGATVVSYNPLVRLALLRISPAPASIAALTALLNTIRSNGAVESATLNTLGTTSEVVPNDPNYGLLYNMTKIRADEAWVITRGGPVIAVLDTGVDFTHGDLSGKVVNGFDWGDLDVNPMDVNSHGTHVAGTAAAKTNNGTGVSGASWNSPILNIKIFPNAGSGADWKLTFGVLEAVARGARVINLSVQNFGTSTCTAIGLAQALGRVVVVAAGNSATSTINYPAGCAGSIAVGNTTSTDARSASSNFGAWVDLAAPGTAIYSTIPGGLYGYKTGTSMAAPLVSGAVALLLARQPGLTPSQVETRLKRTAVELPGLQLGAGRIDIFEAVFNGSFEEQSMALWVRVGTANSITSLGPIVPNAPAGRKRMGFVTSGPANDSVSGQISQAFTIQPGVTSFKLAFRYTFVSEEFPEFVGTQFNDSLQIRLVKPDGSTQLLASETVNGSAYSAIGGINFPGGDNTTGWTGWKNINLNIPVTAGPGTYRVFITDAGDDIYDSAVLLDEIRFK